MLLTFGLSYYADKVSLQVMSLIMGQYDTEVVVCSLFKSEVKLLKKTKTKQVLKMGHYMSKKTQNNNNKTSPVPLKWSRCTREDDF